MRTNATPPTIDDLNNIPVKFANGATVFLKDVAQVRDGSAVQQNIVRADGQRSVLLSIIKNGNASTLEVVNRVKEALQTARAAAPAGLKITELFDQSVFVTRSVEGVLREGAIAAALTALMILLFLGSWRSTLVVMISIPLSILTSFVVLYFLGETLNTMTLGGLALAVGILVDDSTVTIENTHRLLTEEGRPLPEATLHGAAGIAVPTLVSTLAISCVFTSVVFLEGPSKYLFTPLGLAVVFAMLASYGLSRTLTPITIGLLLKGEHHGAARWFAGEACSADFKRDSTAASSACAKATSRSSPTCCITALIVPAAAVLILGLGATMLVFVGRDFFPLIDGGQIQLHVRAPAGTRIEATEKIFQAVEDKIREIIPESDRALIVDNIGLPARAYNLAFADGSTIGVNDGTILVSLKEGHAPTADYVRKLREALPAAFPENVFYFQAADIVTQILNFGLPAQIDVRTVGYDRGEQSPVAKELQRRIAAIPGYRRRASAAGSRRAGVLRDHRSRAGAAARPQRQHDRHQSQCQPELIRAGLAEFLDRSDLRHSLLHRGPDPEPKVDSLERPRQHARFRHALAGGAVIPGLLSNVATLKRATLPTNTNQTNIQPIYDVYASVQGRDLGSVAADINKIVADLQSSCRPAIRSSRRPDPEHERRLPRPRHRPVVRRRVRLPADGRELPELRRSIRRHPGACRRRSAAFSRCSSSPARRSTCPR